MSEFKKYLVILTFNNNNFNYITISMDPNYE